MNDSQLVREVLTSALEASEPNLAREIFESFNPKFRKPLGLDTCIFCGGDTKDGIPYHQGCGGEK